MKFITRRVIAVACLATAVGCASKSDITELKASQDKIIAKLDEIKSAAAPGAPQRPSMPDPAKVYAMTVDNAQAKGPKDAWITVVEVSDFQCPFCKRVGPTMTELEKKYGEDIRFVFKHNPLGFHNRAMPAAMATECAGDQGKFWQMHDHVFENQRALEDTDLETYAKAVGLDVAKWKECFTANKHKDNILAHQTEAGKLGARGTPAFFINGRFLSGAQPTQNFEALIDEELAKAKKSGIAKNEYYKKTVVDAGAKDIN